MPTIAEIHTHPFRLPMKGSLSWGKASRLDALEHVLVQLVTDTGHTGWAEATPRPTIYGETPQSIQTIIHDHLAPRLIGMDIDDTKAINRAMDVIANNHTAKGAIDISLHEAIAASRGQTLFNYLNPIHRRVKVSYILGIADEATMLAEAQSVYDQGVRVLKVKVGRNFDDDVRNVRLLQQEFAGTDLSLYGDANEGLAPNQAHDQLRRLADLGLLYVEEPLPVERIAERSQLRATQLLPLIADDSTFTPRDLRRELYFDTFDILNIKTARTGYTHSFGMLDAVRAHGKGVMIGSQASSTIGTIRAALFAGLEGIDHPSELSFFLKVEDDIVNRPIEIVAGYIDLSTLTTIEIDETKLKQRSL
ncbi:MAG: enolase [Anaerolineae bacterium]|nr:enolase [Anaerolineae bacterium]